MTTPSSAEELVERIRPLGEEIGKAAKAGDRSAQAVIDAYALVQVAPSDPGAIGICSAALEAWVASRAVTP